jgi:hypothetical protein
MHPSSPAARRWILIGAAALFLAALCWLPYRVPATPTVSESYAFGYNNRVGQWIVAAGALLLALWGPRLPTPQSTAARPLRRSTLYKALAVSLLLAVALFLFTRKLEGFGESIYLIDRVKLVLEGRIPYKQFEYAYGAIFLYGPAWMSRWLHLSVGDAYGIFWLLVNAAGICLLYKTIEWIDSPAVDKRGLFILFWVLSLPMLQSAGVNYSLFRYLLPCFFALLVYRKLAPASQPRPQALALLLPVPLLGLLLCVSPELALTFAVGTAFYLAWFGHLRTGRNALFFAIMLAGFGVLIYLAEKAGILATLRAFSTGGLNFPLMPAPHLLLLFFCIGLAACYAAQRLGAGEPTPLLLLIAVSALSLTAALGRCDQGHALMNPIGLMLAASFIAAGMPRLWPWFRAAMLVIFLLLPLPLSLYSTGTLLAKAALPTFFASEQHVKTTAADRWILARMTRALGAERAREKFDDIRALAQMRGDIDVAEIFGMPPETIFEAPFGFTPTRFGTYHSPSIDEGYYFEATNLVTPEAIARKLSELSSHPGRPLLLLPSAEDYCTVHADSSRGLQLLFVYPYRAHVVHPQNLLAPLCGYIHQNYHVQEPATPAHYGYALWAPN